MEHLRYDKMGGLAGLYRLDPSKAEGIDVWAKIDDVIRAYTKIHPNEMQMLVMENQYISKTRRTESASSKSKSLRWGASIPPALLFNLEVVEPNLFFDKKLFHKFLRKYKGFRICKTV